MQVKELSLPESLAKVVEQEVSKGGYESVDRYIRHLISVEQKRRAKERLEQLMVEGLESGEPVKATPECWASLRDEIHSASRA
jgi:antitoxin ParD1/3/4